jgi:hypothetical protein
VPLGSAILGAMAAGRYRGATEAMEAMSSLGGLCMPQATLAEWHEKRFGASKSCSASGAASGTSRLSLRRKTPRMERESEAIKFSRFAIFLLGLSYRHAEATCLLAGIKGRKMVGCVPPESSTPRPVADRAAHFYRRVIAAIFAGMGLASIALWGFDPSVASEFGRHVDNSFDFFRNQAGLSWVNVVPGRDGTEESDSRGRERRASKHAAGPSLANALCVRLCDGYFFPASGDGSLTNRQASCGAVCPGAATELFLRPAGADGIDDASSLSGVKYTALPNAYRYRSGVSLACTCHNEVAENDLRAMQDSTLRKGDVVMTTAGMQVFAGGHAPYGARNFISLAKATLPRQQRETLAAMERETLRRVQVASPPLRQAKSTRIVSLEFLKWPASQREGIRALH